MQEARSRHQRVDQKAADLLLWPPPGATLSGVENEPKPTTTTFARCVCKGSSCKIHFGFSFCALILMIKTTLPDDPASKQKQKQKQVMMLLLLFAIQPAVLCSFNFPMFSTRNYLCAQCDRCSVQLRNVFLFGVLSVPN